LDFEENEDGSIEAERDLTTIPELLVQPGHAYQDYRTDYYEEDIRRRISFPNIFQK